MDRSVTVDATFLGQPDEKFPTLKNGGRYLLTVSLKDDGGASVVIQQKAQDQEGYNQIGWCPYETKEAFYANWNLDEPIEKKEEDEE